MVLRECSAPSCSKKESEELEFDNCSRCKQVCYCSRECQKAHWVAGHKRDCKRLRLAGTQSKKESALAGLAKEMNQLAAESHSLQKQLLEVVSKQKRNRTEQGARKVVMGQLDAIDDDTPTYLGIGKMYLMASHAAARKSVEKEEAISVAHDGTLAKKKKWLEMKLIANAKAQQEIEKQFAAAGYVARRR